MRPWNLGATFVWFIVGAIGTPRAGATPPSAVGARRRATGGAACASLGLALAIAAWTAAAPAEAAVVDPELRIVIRTYVQSTPLDETAAALAIAAGILEGAGVAVTWINCDTVFVRRDEDPCRRPIAANELAVRFIRPSPSVAEQDMVPLGDSLVDTRMGTGSLATIYVDRVATLAARCGMDTATLMGRAVAHEVGHLLLGTAAHASTGVMRAAWTQRALRRAGGDWTFTDADARTLRERARARNARRLAAGRIGE